MSGKEKLITKIEVQKRNKERVSIFIEGEYAFSCSAELVYTHGLKSNKAVNIEKLQEVVCEDNFLKCKNDALKTIERSYKSEKEILDKLFKKEYDEKTIVRTMQFLKSYNFLNDEQFAAMYIKDKIKNQGKNKIKHSLLRKGIDEVMLEDKLREVDNSSQLKTALKLVEKKHKTLSKTETDNRKIYSKLWEYLLRNGFDKDIIEETISKVEFSNEQVKDLEKKNTDYEELKRLADKRYSILIKTEDNSQKIYKKLADYLMRRGYGWEDIKPVLKAVTNNSELEEDM